MFSPLFMFCVLFNVSSLLYAKKLCDFNNTQCLIENSRRTFVPLVSGRPGVEPSDPLRLELIEGNLPTIKFKIIDGVLSGMRNCQVELLKIDVNDMKFDYHIGCPHITIYFGFELKGAFGPEFIEGRGENCKVDFYRYHFLFNGDYERKIDKDGKMHFHVISHNLELEAREKIHYECKNLFNGDKTKSDFLHKFANENWQTVDKLTRQPIMEAFMNKYMENINAYLDIVPVEDLFSE